MIKINYSGNTIISKDLIGKEKINILYNRIDELLSIIDYTPEERHILMTMINRIIGRSKITESEYFKIMGILRQIINS